MFGIFCDLRSLIAIEIASKLVIVEFYKVGKQIFGGAMH